MELRIQKQNESREFAKKLALEKWHRQKREEERLKRGADKYRNRTDKRFPLIDFGFEKYKLYDPKIKKAQNNVANMTKLIDKHS